MVGGCRFKDGCQVSWVADLSSFGASDWIADRFQEEHLQHPDRNRNRNRRLNMILAKRSTRDKKVAHLSKCVPHSIGIPIVL